MMRFKKCLTRIISTVLLVAVSFSAFAACKKKAVPNTENDLEILYWISGLGTEYALKINQAFKEEYPEINLHFTPTPTFSALSLYANPSKNSIDLYFMPFEDYLQYQEYLEPLNDVLTKKPDSDGRTIAQKIGRNIDLLTPRDANGNTYVLPYANTVSGIAYNVDIFAKEGYKIPRTTNELIILADDMADDGYTPFIHIPVYDEFLYKPWVAQLEGLETYYELFSAIYTDENGNKHTNDIRALTDYSIGTGRYEALKALRELVCKEKNIYYGSTSLSHTASQTYFLNKAAVMSVNGSWLENEMSDTSTQRPNISMMKPPVISALGTKLGITEQQLRAAVSYADGDATLAEEEIALNLPEEKLNAVIEARSIMFSLATQHTLFIPNYSLAKDAAKKYVEFYFSDVAMKIMADTTKMSLPVTLSENTVLDMSSWSTFAKRCFELSIESTLMNTVYSEKINYLPPYNSRIKDIFYTSDAGNCFAYSQNQKDMWTLDKFIAHQIANVEGNWQLIKTAAGIS